MNIRRSVRNMLKNKKLNKRLSIFLSTEVEVWRVCVAQGQKYREQRAAALSLPQITVSCTWPAANRRLINPDWPTHALQHIAPTYMHLYVINCTRYTIGISVTDLKTVQTLLTGSCMLYFSMTTMCSYYCRYKNSCNIV